MLDTHSPQVLSTLTMTPSCLPHVQLRWLNTTYIKGQGLLTDAEYTWTNGANVIGTDLDLTTAPRFLAPLARWQGWQKPTLATDDKADGNYTFGGNIYYGAAPATATATPSSPTPAQLPAPSRHSRPAAPRP